MSARAIPRIRRLALGVLVLAALGAVFAWYLDPHLVVDLANQAWGCF